MIEKRLYGEIRADKKLMNKLAWEAANGNAKSAEEAARGILDHPRRSARFKKLFSSADPLELMRAVVQILNDLKDWQVE